MRPISVCVRQARNDAQASPALQQGFSGGTRPRRQTSAPVPYSDGEPLPAPFERQLKIGMSMPNHVCNEFAHDQSGGIDDVADTPVLADIAGESAGTAHL